MKENKNLFFLIYELTIQLKYYDLSLVIKKIWLCYVMAIDYDIEMQNIFTNFEIKQICSDLLLMFSWFLFRFWTK
jgi:hypothetical protein